MSQNAQWVWEVRAVKSPFDRDDLLAEGWEPFAVTINALADYIYHLRKKVKK